MKAKITVLLSVYNEEESIGPTIQSILSQTFKEFSFWIIDDGSKDGTWKVIKSFKDKRLKPIHFTKNMGMTPRLNWAIPQIKTQFIARMDSHNLAKKNRLKKQYDFMLANPSIMALGSNFIRVDNKGNVILKTKFPTHYQAIKSTLMERNVFKHASVLVRKVTYKKVGLYDPAFKIAQDYDFILRVAASYPVANLPDYLITDVQRKQNTTRKYPTRTALESLMAQINGLTKYHYPLWQSVFLLRGLGFYLKSYLPQ